MPASRFTFGAGGQCGASVNPAVTDGGFPTLFHFRGQKSSWVFLVFVPVASSFWHLRHPDRAASARDT